MKTEKNANTGPVVGRFAPTPSGRLHLGNIFTAMLAWLSAKSAGGRILLRIEDLDKERCPKGSVETLLDDLRWFGFSFDGDILFQSERGDIYGDMLNRLEKLIYPCYCSRAQLHASTAPHGDTPIYNGRCRSLPLDKRPDKKHCLRITAADKTVEFTDLVQGEYSQNLKTECGDFIVRRADGVYAYQLAVVADDALSGVTEVVRGRDLLSSAPRQLYLYELLGFKAPEFAHVPLLTDENGERLSKREGRSNLEYIRKAYSSPQPIIGMLAYNAGLLPAFEPAALNDLTALFDWKKIKKHDVPLNTCGLF
jgi:glutamyl-queuosine tRNA(asp) synthetase